MTTTDSLASMSTPSPSIALTSLDITAISEEVIPTKTSSLDRKKNDTEKTSVSPNGFEKKLPGTFYFCIIISSLFTISPHI